MTFDVAGVDGLLAQYRHLYPDALAMVSELVEDRGQRGLPDWPEWCWLPMAGTIAYLDCKQGDRHDIARVAALTQWRLDRGVYVIDDAVVSRAVGQLWDSAGGNEAERWVNAALPRLDSWKWLPQWCCYVVWPPDVTTPARELLPTPLGVFVHLEWDSNTERPELRLLLDRDGTWDGLLPIPVYLDRPTLGLAISDMCQNALAGGPRYQGRQRAILTEAGPRCGPKWGVRVVGAADRAGLCRPTHPVHQCRSSGRRSDAGHPP
jgi:hypothetical protein